MSDTPPWSQALRALREAAGVTRAGWAASLGYGRTTVQRWETGESAPDAQAETALTALCRERALFRRYETGALAGVTTTPEWLGDLLAQARLDGGNGQPATGNVEPGRGGFQTRPHGPNLPIPLTSFVGREVERAEALRLLGETRLLTLTGAGGCGKTRLALAVAERVRGDGESVAVVELAALADATRLAGSVALTLGVREEAGRALEETLTSALMSARLLLILDNCEHLTAACARLATLLLTACPELTILATSRERLGITGEVVYRVPPLTVPSSEFRVPSAPPHSELGTRNSELEQADSVRLFAERARAVRPEFALTDGNVGAVVEVCRRLDGLPLAIELAAARLNLLSVEQIGARLGDRFRLLTGGSRTALPRQQTLRALVDWSYELLGDGERRLFERLSVFAGGFSLEAVEAVCGDRLDELARLVDASMVIVEEAAGEARYRLLETLRQYGRERLDERGEVGPSAERHRDYYLALAEEAEPELLGADQSDWLVRLSGEVENLRAALHWCEQDSGDAEKGLRLARALWRFWQVRGLFSEGRNWLERLLARGEAVAPLVRARAMNSGGTLAFGQGDHAAAEQFWSEGLALAREADDGATVARALANLGLVRMATGDTEAAEALLEEALDAYRRLRDRRGVARTLHDLGALAHRRRDLALARSLYEECLDIWRRLGDRLALAGTVNNLADLARQEGDLATAHELFQEALALRRALGDEQGIVSSLHGLGETACRQGEYAPAGACFSEALALAARLGSKRAVAENLEGLARVLGARREPEDAVRLLSAADGLRASIAAPLATAERAQRGELTAELRTALGDAAYTRAWEAGRVMALDRVIALALAGGGA